MEPHITSQLDQEKWTAAALSRGSFMFRVRVLYFEFDCNQFESSSLMLTRHFHIKRTDSHLCRLLMSGVEVVKTPRQ
jgi:hypothetical protein